MGMRALEIGDFKEDVGAALARASSGEVVTLTEEGQPVAELGPVRMSTYQQLRDVGSACSGSSGHGCFG